MAEKVKLDNKIKVAGNQPEKPKKKVATIFKVLLIALILLIIAAAGFALGIYLKIFDLESLTTSWKLNEYPIIGQYFPQPKTNFEPVELDQQDQTQTPINPTVVPPVVPEALTVEKGKVDDSELQKQAKIKQQEEAKRISKLARLYGGMKPDEAVVILNNLDDNTVLDILSKMEDEQVSKIMAKFDSKRAANLTQAMLRGKNFN
jgi:flagellar protein FlbB